MNQIGRMHQEVAFAMHCSQETINERIEKLLHNSHTETSDGAKK